MTEREPTSRAYWRQNEIQGLRASLGRFARHDAAQGAPEIWQRYQADRQRLAELEQLQRPAVERLARMKAPRLAKE